MNCHDCNRASAELWHGFQSGCAGCKARAMARGPHYFACKRAGKLNPLYLQQLERMSMTHDQVKEADAADFMSRRSSP